MLSINDLKSGIYIIYRGEPHEVLEAHHLMLGRGGGMVQAKLKNVKTGNVINETVKGSNVFEEAEITYKKIKFLYHHRGVFTFTLPSNKSQRFELSETVIGDAKPYLILNLELEGVYLGEEVINVKLPPKVDMRVREAPPQEKGNTAQGGRKPVTVETGLKVNVPFFISEGEVIRVNTKTGEYVERVTGTK